MNNQVNMEYAVESLLRGFDYILKQSLNKTTQIYEGIIISNNNDGKWNIQYNGETHAVKPYGNIVPSVGKNVKVIIPQGNQAVAFFI